MGFEGGKGCETRKLIYSQRDLEVTTMTTTTKMTDEEESLL